jgi:hypothetical protein
MTSMWWQLGILGTIAAFAYRRRETKKNLCRGGRSQDRQISVCMNQEIEIKHLEASDLPGSIGPPRKHRTAE